MTSFVRAAVRTGAALAMVSQVYAQRGSGDWTTTGYDAQRSHWLRNDAKISPAVVSKPGFELLWKVKLKGTLTPPALLDFYIGHRGFRTLGFVGASPDAVVAIDTDLSRIEWETKVGSGTPAAAGTPQCPGGMTSSVARITSLAYAPMGGGMGRGTPAKGGVGEPGEGAVTLRNRPPQPNFPPPPAAASTKGGRRTATPPGPFSRGPQYVHAISSDGKLHMMYLASGEEPNPALPFLPANANARGVLVFDNVVYAATVNGCGGVEDGLWALDLESKKVAQWKSTSGNVVGTDGFAAGPDGTLYVAAGNELVALEPITLTPKGSYKTGGAIFTSSPIVFEFKGKNVIAASTGDGKIHLVNSDGMAPVEAFAAGLGNYAVGALASWQDAGGSRWLLAPSASKVMAWKVADKGGMPALEQGWASRDLVSPITPAIVNGVIFAVSAGRRTTPAVLYALDSGTGKDVWSSGKSILSSVTTGGLAAGGARVYVSTVDGTQYAFGIPMEH